MTSILTLFQSFSLETFVGCLLHLTLFIYLFHILFRRTRVWKEFHLNRSPFNEIKNDTYFYTIIVFTIFLLAIDLIATTTPDGTILSCLDAFFLGMFARYIYLYGCFADNKEKKINPATSIDEIKEKVEEVKDKLDEVVDDIKDTVGDTVDSVMREVDHLANDDSDNEKKIKKTKKDTKDTKKKRDK